MDGVSPHSDSILGRIFAEEEAIQARRQLVTDLVSQRRAEVAEVQAALEAIPVHTDDLQAVVDLLGRGEAVGHLLSLAEREAKHLVGEADRVRERVALIAVTRINRLREEIALLGDDTRAVPLSPIERQVKLWEARCKLAILEGSPAEAATILQEVENVITDPDRRRAVLASLETYRLELASVVGLPMG